MKTKVARALIAIVVLLGAACSEQVKYRHEGDRCIEHRTSRLFGLPILQEERKCP